MSVYVRDGTPRFGGATLCESCSHALVTRGEAPSEVSIQCGWNGPPRAVRFKVTSCNAYLERTKTPYHEMERLAWHVDVDHKSGAVGFLSPHERQHVMYPPLREGTGFR